MGEPSFVLCQNYEGRWICGCMPDIPISSGGLLLTGSIISRRSSLRYRNPRSWSSASNAVALINSSESILDITSELFCFNAVSLLIDGSSWNLRLGGGDSEVTAVSLPSICFVASLGVLMLYSYWLVAVPQNSGLAMGSWRVNAVCVMSVLVAEARGSKEIKRAEFWRLEILKARGSRSI